jgi:hypothetical protein
MLSFGRHRSSVSAPGCLDKYNDAISDRFVFFEGRRITHLQRAEFEPRNPTEGAPMCETPQHNWTI